MNSFVPIAIVSAVVALNWRTRDRHVAAFAKAYRVPVTAETAGPLWDTVRRSRQFRWACAGVALIIYALSLADGNGAGLWGMLGAVAIGFGVGSIIDELTRTVRTSHRATVASLEQRSVRTYVEQWVLVFLGAVIVTVAFQGWRALVVAESTVESWAPEWSRVQIAGVLAIGPLALAVGAFAVNRIAQRPAPADTTEMQMLRHGIRVSGVVSIVGALFVIIGAVGVTMTSFTFGAREPEPYNWLHLPSLIICFFAFYTGLMLSIQALPSGRWARDLPALPQAPRSQTSAP